MISAVKNYLYHLINVAFELKMVTVTCAQMFLIISLLFHNATVANTLLSNVSLMSFL